MTYKNVNLDLEVLHEAEVKVAEYEQYLNSPFKSVDCEFPADELHLVKFTTDIQSQIHAQASNLFDAVNSKLSEIEHQIINLSETPRSNEASMKLDMDLKEIAAQIHMLREFFASSWIDATPSVPDIVPLQTSSRNRQELTHRLRKLIKERNLKSSE